jgi:tRNA(Arg) A34 adenosine deaminase TadA
MLTHEENRFLERAIELSRLGMQKGQGGPFGCVIVRENQVIAEGTNQVTSANDPTAHAEVVAIREACRKINNYQLEGCDVYTSCDPCPMCLGAIYWARPRKVIFANTRQQAAAIEFDDDFIYGEINALPEDRRIPFVHAPNDKALEVFTDWLNWEGKKKY